MTMLTDPRIGTELAGYRIDRLLGRGGMSVVYLAEDPRLKRKVALKLLDPDLAANEAFRTAFLRESELAAGLDHPNVLPVYEAGEAHGHLFIAMRLVRGDDLGAMLRREKVLDPDRALNILGQIAGALDAAHAMGLIHRDVKPANVLIVSAEGTEAPDHAYLSDFGLAKRVTTRSGLTKTGPFMGSVDYAAPEQILGKQVDGGADLYSLGCVLYQCLSGEVPFRKETEGAVVYAHLTEPPPSVRILRPELPKEIDAVIAGALAKRPDDRYGSCGELMGAAGQAIRGVAPPVPIATRGPAAEVPAVGPSRPRRRQLALLASMVVVAGLLVAVFVATPGSPTRIRPPVDSLVGLDPTGADVVTAIGAGSRPTFVAIGMNSGWVVSTGDRTLRRFDLRTGRVIRSTGLGGSAATGLAADDRFVWVTDEFGGTVSRIDPATGVPRTESLHPGCKAIAIGGGAVWIVNVLDGDLVRLDPDTLGQIGDPIPVGERPEGIAFGGGSMWVASSLDRTVTRVDALTGKIQAKITMPHHPYALAFGAGRLWVANSLEDSITEVDPATEGAVKTIPVGHGPFGIAAGDGAVWVSNSLDGTVWRFDVKLGRFTRRSRLGNSPEGIAVAPDGSVWVALHSL
jgi:YVTN family beta-propeller protein